MIPFVLKNGVGDCIHTHSCTHSSKGKNRSGNTQAIHWEKHLRTGGRRKTSCFMMSPFILTD